MRGVELTARRARGGAAAAAAAGPAAGEQHRAQALVARDGPDRAGVEAGVQQPVPGRQELARLAVLQVEVVPAVEEEAEDEQAAGEGGHHVVAPDGARGSLRGGRGAHFWPPSTPSELRASSSPRTRAEPWPSR